MRTKGLYLRIPLILLLALLVGMVSYRLGRRGRDEKSEGQKENTGVEEAGTEARMVFGSDSIVLGLCHPDGSISDFSCEEASAALVPLADRLISELEDMGEVAEAAAFYQRSAGNVYHGTDGLQTGNILGVGTGFLSAAGFQVETGRGFTERDLKEKKRVALLDGRAAQLLFAGEDPIGEIVEIEGRLYQVVGIVKAGKVQAGGGLVLVPESTWPEIGQYEEPKAVVLRVSEPEEPASEEEWKHLLEETGICAARMLNSMVPKGEELRYEAWETW